MCLIYAILLTPKATRTLSRAEVADWRPEQGLLWTHWDYTQDATDDFLRSRQLPDICLQALQSEDTRPRTLAVGDGLLLALRAINHSPGQTPDDLVAMRGYFDRDQIITTSRRHLEAFDRLAKRWLAGEAPSQSAEVLRAFCQDLYDELADYLWELDEHSDSIETRLMLHPSRQLRPLLRQVRLRSLRLRRYLAPQREALAYLAQGHWSWISSQDQLHLREQADHMMRAIEHLDSLQARSNLLNDELGAIQSEQLNQRTYHLSLMASIFLPLTFLTGLLGVNIGGIPGSNHAKAFWVFVGLLIAVSALQAWWFQRKRWL
jgi:zinc transporter